MQYFSQVNPGIRLGSTPRLVDTIIVFHLSFHLLKEFTVVTIVITIAKQLIRNSNHGLKAQAGVVTEECSVETSALQTQGLYRGGRSIETGALQRRVLCRDGQHRTSIRTSIISTQHSVHPSSHGSIYRFM